MNQHDTFSTRLTYLRKQKHISSRKMSLAIGQNESYISRIESRLSYPSMDVFFRMCEYLGVGPAEFFEEELDNPTALREAMYNLRELDEEHLEIVNRVIKGFLN